MDYDRNHMHRFKYVCDCVGAGPSSQHTRLPSFLFVQKNNMRGKVTKMIGGMKQLKGKEKCQADYNKTKIHFLWAGMGREDD